MGVEHDTHAAERTRRKLPSAHGRPQPGRPRPPRSDEPLNILLVEDNPGDVALVRRALQGWHTPTTLVVAASGEEAMLLLHQMQAAARPLPSLMLLDLNLPGIRGHEVLGQMKADLDLRSIPVIVLSGSG